MGLFIYLDVDCVVLVDGEVELLKIFGVIVVYCYFWSLNWCSLLLVFYIEIVDDLIGIMFLFGMLSYFDVLILVYVNLLWLLYKKLIFGVEYVYWNFVEIVGDGDE